MGEGKVRLGKAGQVRRCVAYRLVFFITNSESFWVIT